MIRLRGSVIVINFAERVTGDRRNLYYFATFWIQVWTARSRSGQRQRTTDDVLSGGQRAATEPGTAANHGDTAGGRGRGHRRVSAGQTGAAAPNWSEQSDRFRFSGGKPDVKRPTRRIRHANRWSVGRPNIPQVYPVPLPSRVGQRFYGRYVYIEHQHQNTQCIIMLRFCSKCI